MNLLVSVRGGLRKPAAELGKAAKKMAPEQAEVAKQTADKLFAASDDIRKRLAELGIVLEDSADGTKWNLGG